MMAKGSQCHVCTRVWPSVARAGQGGGDHGLHPVVSAAAAGPRPYELRAAEA